MKLSRHEAQQLRDVRSLLAAQRLDNREYLSVLGAEQFAFSVAILHVGLLDVVEFAPLRLGALG